MEEVLNGGDVDAAAEPLMRAVISVDGVESWGH
jgi:hypothetical protein